MAIKIDLDVVMAQKKVTVTQLSQAVGITMANISILKTGKARAIRFSTLEKICEVLDCQLGDILKYEAERDKPRSTN
ncbi:transcriptional regulator [Pediococcus ethanolidurans]|uniref:helix-turn-helix domain-containing protein n=1 Tax=Pediococcus ethanolidurans TaxID=319653 RepID=UPI001C1EF35C|nr:helix-turn-helix transcriptional regulator [Pediococcus ethanolidurans]MBU7555516.1 helix-turn-helix transcriptional regulator [Pediococcus ethanolidurans]MCT4397423.1 transcriptional regulator [Pediococcus ethanolidurans]